MKLGPSDVLKLLSFPALMSIGQLLFRKAAIAGAGKPVKEMMLLALREPTFLLAIFLYGSSTILWLWLLGRYSLAVAYPFAIIAVVTVPLLERFCFNQPLPSTYWIGLALVAGGAFVIVRGS